MQKNLDKLKMEIEIKEKNSEELVEKMKRNKEKKIHLEAEKNKEKTKLVNENLLQLSKRRERSFVKMFKKYDKIEQNVLLQNMERRKNSNMMIKGMNKYRELTVENRRKLSEEKQKKIEENEKKKEKQVEKYNEMKKKMEEEYFMKKEQEKIKNIEKANLIKRKIKIAEYQNKLKMNELEEKEKKIQMFKIQREKLAQQRIETSIGIEKKKEAILKKFDNLMKQNKEIDPETIKDVFPDDEELIKKVTELKKKQKIEEEKIKKKLEEQINTANKETEQK